MRWTETRKGRDGEVFCSWCGFFTEPGGNCHRCGSPMIERELSLLQRTMLDLFYGDAPADASRAGN
jgi:uncharacterized paraquat-inducible protein A